MSKKSKAFDRIFAAAIRHIRDGEPLENIPLSKDEAKRIKRVAHVFSQCQSDPRLDAFILFKRLAAGRYNSSAEEWQVAKKDLELYQLLL